MRNNILFLLVDQWPAKAFGFEGDGIDTPNMDQLAARSTVFENAYTTCPLCSPARGALFTSRWHTQTGLLDNLNVGYTSQEALDITEETWVDASVTRGYKVGYYGKWHLGPNGPIIRGAHGHAPSIEADSKPYIKGVSDYSYQGCKSMYEKDAKSLISGNSHFYGCTDQKIEETNPYLVANSGCEFIRDYAKGPMDQPFMLTVSVNDPHFPHYLPKSFVERKMPKEVPMPKNIKDDFRNKPWFVNKAWWPSMDTSSLSDDEWVNVIKYAYMHRMLVDEAMGKVIDTLKNCGLDETTTIIFTSDHGDMCGAHNRFDKGPYYYEEVWRVPLFIKEPNVKPSKQEANVSLLDVGRTVFGMVGHTTVKELVGRDLRPLVGKVDPPYGWNQRVYGMYDNYNGMSFKVRAIKNGLMKYIYNPQSVDELYDLAKDPAELNNVIGEKSYKSVEASLKEDLLVWMRSIKDPLLTEKDTIPVAGYAAVLGASAQHG